MLSAWRQMTPQERRDAKTGYLALSPWMVGFVIFYAFPILATFYFSLTQWTLVDPPVWIGLDNYVRMFTRDPLFISSLKATTLFVALSLPLKLVLGLMLALLLNLKIPGMNLFRTVFFIPAVISGVAVSLMWIWFLQPDTGVVNTLLSYIGVRGPYWFWDLNWALPSVAIMSIWKVGGAAIIYLAGLQNIPAHLYEAAEIDGAGKWRRFWRITLPLLTPTLFFQLIIELIDAFKIFTEAFVITKGGPLKATYFFLYYFYEEAFRNFNMGYASALALFLLVVIMGCTVFVYRTSGRWVFYEN
ncbi:MAG: sugar ABC transporter permease [Chloroflexota bacterium]|nr:sugar ABC transporter permease [Chloroflexota bacterium]MDE2857282.1 sugar ABC transporter permease [Chloroflexota bacterium]